MKKYGFGIALFFCLSGAWAQTCEQMFSTNVNNFIDACGAGRPSCSEPGGAYKVVTKNGVTYQGYPALQLKCEVFACDTNNLLSGSTTNFYYCDTSINSNATRASNPVRDPVKMCGSIVQVENQVVGESVPIVGADFAMNYFSSWAQGRSADYTLKVPIAGAIPRDDISSFDVIVKDGATTLASTSYTNNQSNVEYSYLWNGLDSSSNPMIGTKTLQVTVTEHRPLWDIPVATNVVVGSFRAVLLGLGGWVPSIYHFYDVNSSTLYSGDGVKRKVTAIAWNTTGWMVAETDGSLVYYFDSTGRQVYTKTGLLGTTLYTFNYNGSGELTSITEPFSRTTSFNRNGSGIFTSITAPKGQITTIGIDANGFISSITNPNSEGYSMTYYGTNGLLHTFEKPRGDESTFTYDSYGNLTKDTHSGGYFFDIVKNLNTSYTLDYSTYSKLNRHTRHYGSGDISNISRQTVYPTGESENYSYQNSGGGYTNKVSSRKGVSTNFANSPDTRFGAMVEFPYSVSVSGGGLSYSISRSQSITLSNSSDPFSISTYSENWQKGSFNVTTSYTPSTKTFSSSSALGNTSEVVIDTYERVASQKRGNLYPFEFTYTNENLTKIKQSSRETNLTYNSTTGFLSTITNPLSQTMGFTYDSAGRVTSQILPDLRTIVYSYDANGNISGITPPGRTIHSFGINASELPGSYAPPTLSGITNVNTLYTYNDDKQLTLVTRPTGGAIGYTYHSTTGALTEVSTPSNTYSIATNTTNGLPSSISSTYGPVTIFSYSGTVPKGYTTYAVGYSGYISGYNKYISSNGTIGADVVDTSASYSQIYYSYNNDEYLTGAGDLTLAYSTPSALLTGTSIGSSSNIVTDEYTYNSFGEMTNYKAKYGTSVIYDLDLARDGMGRIYSKTQTMNSTTDDYDYTFDSVGRLTQTNKNSSTVATYGYDDNSNRNSGTIGGAATSATYDAQDRMTAYNLLSFTYNANGDLTGKTNTLLSTTTSYIYDVFGNLTSVTLPNSDVITYEVDPLNRRIGKKYNGTLQKRWVYMDQTRIAAEINSSGTITKRFVYGSKSNIPDYMVMGGENYRIISDHLGSPRLVVKVSDGSITGRMNHDEFGRVTEDTNPGLLPFGFGGGLYDGDTGLVRFGARDYDAETGRWTAKDPILFAGGDTNLFGYVAQDPVNWVDPSGLARCTYSISGKRLVCTSNDGSQTIGVNAGASLTPLPTGHYDIRKAPGQTQGNWFLDPGLFSRSLYRASELTRKNLGFGFWRGGFNIHLPGRASEGCISAPTRDNSGTGIQDLDSLFGNEAGSNTLDVIQ